jgi:carbamoyl-phosphate synthase large subunit
MISEKMSPDALSLMRGGSVQMIVNTPTQSSGARRDGFMMRRLAVELEIPMLTTLNGASAAVLAMEHAMTKAISVNDLASFHS